VTLAAGDFYVDDLPAGADFAWVSAICHQHSRRHNRELFAKVYRALAPGGRIAIRDVVMEPCRTQPRDGALFAINMLVNTDTGGTFRASAY
jgi:SAM-dependent methyltransferase